MSVLADIFSAPYNAVTGKLTSWQQDAALKEGQASIDQVAANAETYYGGDVAIVAANEAERQKAELAANEAALAVEQTKDSCGGGVDLRGLGLGCISGLADIQKWVRIGLVLLVVGVIAYGYVVFIAPFTNRRG